MIKTCQKCRARAITNLALGRKLFGNQSFTIENKVIKLFPSHNLSVQKKNSIFKSNLKSLLKQFSTKMLEASVGLIEN